MEKLESKEIVGYLPFGLKIRTCKGAVLELNSNMLGVNSEGSNKFYHWFVSQDSKPILHPLSDLEKEILLPSTVNWSQVLEDFKINNNADFLPYHIVKILYEWHFDIHNLINRGLAIDINTL